MASEFLQFSNLLKAFQSGKFHSQMASSKTYKQPTTTISSYYAHRTRKEEKEKDTEEKKEEKILHLCKKATKKLVKV